ncbi:MAG: polyphosphate polymerase domain-containing protein [Clostridiales bacterium]|jgi:hypothetical protein|nr:polyphosphate polymerase domain-containing protein [Clostridiales bacterium]
MTARREFKHSLNYLDYLSLRSRLAATLQRDQNADENGEYKVRSLYFDTPRDQALREKIDGVDRREKFRIRRYNSEKDILNLEKKCKAHGLCSKKSELISRSELTSIQEGDINWMAHDKRPLVADLHANMVSRMLRPKVIVEYIREPFIYKAGNIRITFDKKIRTGVFSTDFLNDSLATVPVGDDIILLEVKYDEFIPDFIQDLLQTPNRRAAAFSKYAMSRIYG